MKKLDSLVVEAVNKQSDSTHGTAPSPSAARLIQYLRGIYPAIAFDEIDHSF